MYVCMYHSFTSLIPQQTGCAAQLRPQHASILYQALVQVLSEEEQVGMHQDAENAMESRQKEMRRKLTTRSSSA